MVTYFADTSFWIALSSRRGQHHIYAVAWQAELARTRSKVVTTEPILWEWLNALADTSTRRIAAEGYRRVHTSSGVEVVAQLPEFSAAAITLYRNRTDKDWSMTDCLSFIVMQQRGIAEATTDHHLEQAGFKAMMLSLPSD